MCKISVIMSVYKEKTGYLRQAVNSILNQTYGDFEFIIVLDEPDNEKPLFVLREYEKQDERIRLLINESNMGLAMSLNRAIMASRGMYLARMDSDDISLPDRFRQQVEYMDSHPDISVLGTSAKVIDEYGRIISKASDRPASCLALAKILNYGNIMIHPSVMMKKKDIISLNGYRDFPAGQDYDLWLRAIAAGLKIYNINEYLICYRSNPEGISLSKSFTQFLCSRYLHKLKRERKETGIDTFSKENLMIYLRENGMSNPAEQQHFQQGMRLFRSSVMAMKNHHFISGFKLGIQAQKEHYFLREVLRENIKCFIVKKYFRITENRWN